MKRINHSSINVWLRRLTRYIRCRNLGKLVNRHVGDFGQRCFPLLFTYVNYCYAMSRHMNCMKDNCISLSVPNYKKTTNLPIPHYNATRNMCYVFENSYYMHSKSVNTSSLAWKESTLLYEPELYPLTDIKKLLTNPHNCHISTPHDITLLCPCSRWTY